MSQTKRTHKPYAYKVRVGKSRTGRGVYALERIPKGARILEYTGRKVSKAEQDKDRGKYFFWVSDTEMIDGNISSNTARYINHSCAPNCEADGPGRHIYISALRTIKPGEELTYDYGEEYFNRHIKPRGCRCNKCHSR
ncbi:SET domain-containing protein [Candidatus Kaiserbacteria bacterium]|nr:SET domain-containing protein [Candidatus Kaiserbacteria bacterium]